MGEKSKPIRQEPLHKGTCSGSIWVFHGILGSKQGLRRSAKKLHAEGARKRDQLNRAKGSRGDFVPFRLSLAGCRDSVPAGGWGNAPTVPRPTSPKEVANKGAGSEASLPVTMRSRRSAPKLLSPSTQHCRARWARPDCMTFDHSRSFPQAKGFASAEATRGQWKQTKSAVAPLTPAGVPPCFLIFYWKFFSYCPAFFPGFYSFAQGDNHHVRIYRRSCVRKNDQFLSS